MAMYDPQEAYYMPPGQQQHRGPHGLVFDGKRMRKAIQRKTVDYTGPTVEYSETRLYQRDYRDHHALEPDPAYIRRLEPPLFWDNNLSTSITTKFVHSSVNKVKCPINCVTWTPEGRRLITGASSGEFTLWNGFTFNFETILQAHDTAVRSMVWSHNDQWMITGDHEGIVKYWQSNMNNVKAFSAHKEAVRDITFAPSDMKFATCSDDVSIKIWDFTRCSEEITLTGHGWDVKCVDWHPVTSLLASGSKDNLVKLWDPKSGKCLTTIHGHKNTILAVEWNKNGNWLLTGSRDQLLKIFDIRTMRELQTFRGHKKEVTSASWHPVHEELFSSGSFDGSVLFWCVGLDQPQGTIQNAHEASIWDMAWHPLGHILCTGSNDHTTKFWCRNRPGDTMKDKYNEVKEEEKPKEKYEPSLPTVGGAIPGLGQSGSRRSNDRSSRTERREPSDIKPPVKTEAPPPDMMTPMHAVPPPMSRGPGGPVGPVVFIPGAPNAANGPNAPAMPPAFAMPPTGMPPGGLPGGASTGGPPNLPRGPGGGQPPRFPGPGGPSAAPGFPGSGAAPGGFPGGPHQRPQQQSGLPGMGGAPFPQGGSSPFAPGGPGGPHGFPGGPGGFPGGGGGPMPPHRPPPGQGAPSFGFGGPPPAGGGPGGAPGFGGMPPQHFGGGGGGGGPPPHHMQHPQGFPPGGPRPPHGSHHGYRG